MEEAWSRSARPVWQAMAQVWIGALHYQYQIVVAERLARAGLCAAWRSQCITYKLRLTAPQALVDSFCCGFKHISSRAREANVDLMLTLSQLNYWSALHPGKAGIDALLERGRLQQGMVADIVVFDPVQVAPGSTDKAGENGLPPMAIPHVGVNGVLVKKDNQPTGAWPGLPIRYPPQRKGRFETIENACIK